ncbi:MAG: metallophosphoesterase family protein [bacterium]|nr:metallophosphoesterase family protein [bacterium]
MVKRMKIHSKKVAAVVATSLLVGTVLTGNESFARSSKRAAWNDASSDKNTATSVSDACFVEDGHESAEKQVYSNVYADSTAWNTYKTSWQTIKTNYTQVALTPGENATSLNFAWYSKRTETPMVKLLDANKKAIKVVDGEQNTDKAESFKDGEETVTLYPSKVTITGLKENTSYYYQYLVEGKWSEIYSYKTKDTDDFSVLYVGDPQIGASVGQDTNNAEYHAMNDAYNWSNTISQATKNAKDASFMLSAGDQINQTSVSNDSQKLQQQTEYAGFLAPSALRSLPVATTIGNHDSKSQNYQNHFNNPNAASSSDTTTGATTAGTDYYFRYGNTLFVIIDTNNYNCATHENVMKEAISKNSDATWKVLMFHQDIYGSGYDHSDSDGMILRTTLTPIIDKYDFDAVLQGHDHTYSRTYQISSDSSKAYPGYDKTNYLDGSEPSKTYLNDNANCYDLLSKKTDVNKVIDPEGTVYFEANSATGSKFYQLIGTKQNYIAARSQSYRPTYSVLDFDDVSLTVKTYDAATNQELVADDGVKTSYTIVKSVDKKELNSKISTAEKKLADAKKSNAYTTASVKKLSDTIAAAKTIAANKEASTVDVSSACVSLNDAVKALTKKKAAVISGTTSYKKTYSKNQKFKLNTKVQSQAGKLTYKSSNTKVAKVDSKGMVTIQGAGSVTITVTANATDTYNKAVKTIKLQVSPEKVKKASVKAGKKKATVSWSKVTKASGYEISYSTSSKFTKKTTKKITITKTSTVKKTITSLKSKKKYYVRVRAYQKVGKSKLYGSYSKTIKVAVK